MTAAVASPASWQARLRLELRPGDDRTRLLPRERYGPLAVQKPFYPEGDCCHVYLLHPPGGVVGGDSLELRANLVPSTKALFTTPGACKFYLSDGPDAQVEQVFEVGRQAQFEYLPQENIYFPGARVRMHTTIEAESGASLVLWEKHCFGRPASRETFDSGWLRSSIDLRLDGRLIFIDTQRIDAQQLRRASGLRGRAVCGNLLLLGSDLETGALRELQQVLPVFGAAGITAPRPGLLVARYLGDSVAELDDYFIQLWEELRPAFLGRAACPPRIWNT